MAMNQRPVPQKNSNRDDDSVIYKIMAALVMLCVLLVGLQFTSRYYSVVGTMFTTQSVLLGVGIASAVLFLGSVACGSTAAVCGPCSTPSPGYWASFSWLSL